MDRLAIEINGAGLLVADAHKVLVSEPGYAIVDESGITTGAAAYAQARLQPAKARSGFWSGLSVEGTAAESNAELAYEHLKQVWSRAGQTGSRVLLVVPGMYDTEQLGLVLGIAQECGIEVEAMIDTAVAASALQYEGAQLLYVDASLRTLSVSRLDQSDAATIDARESSDVTGLADFTDEMARAIARVFVLETRLDPLHQAESEQHIYDGLPDWLQALHRDGVAAAEIRHAGEPVAVELTTERVRSASLRLFREIARLIAELRAPNRPAVVQLNHRLAALPGLRAELERIDGLTLTELAPGFPAISALRRIGQTETSADVRFLRRLPFTGIGDSPQPAAEAEPVQEAARIVPTHVVFEGIGYRLGSDGLAVANASEGTVNGTRALVIGERGGSIDGTHCLLNFSGDQLAVERIGGSQVRVNDAPVESGHRLEVGDTLRIGDPAAELHIVALED